MKPALFVVAALGIFLPAPAGAALVMRQDSAGRTMTFDVPRGMNVDPYASVLRRALHGDEIESVTIGFVDRSTLLRFCGRGSFSCYRPGWRDEAEILLPVRVADPASTILHEYAHHLDASYGLTSSRRWGPTAERWWAARRIEARLDSGRVAFNYELGWQRSIAEILAEDYVQLHTHPRYGIRWLRPPSRSVLTALRRDIQAARRS
jgi:hypothetical protein